MEENRLNEDSKDLKFAKELELRSRAVDAGNKLNFLKAIGSVLSLASTIWIFNICFTSCIKWWQLLIFILIMIVSCAVISVEQMVKLSKAAEEMLNEQKSKSQHLKKSKLERNNR